MLLGKGANGKSVFTNVSQALLGPGEYACTMAAETLMVRKYQSAPETALARLPGIRLVVASEAEDGAQLAESLVKQITGGDKIVARRLYHAPFEFPPQFKVWLVTNHRPIIKGDEHAIWRRIRLVSFNVTIPDDQQDRSLTKKLLGELSGILNWAVAGCQAWQHEGLDPPPPCVVEATAAYRCEMDLVAEWLDECCVTGPEVGEIFTPNKTLYASFEAWTREGGSHPMTKKAFTCKLNERGLKRKNSPEARGFLGIMLRPAEPLNPEDLKNSTFIGTSMVDQAQGQEGTINPAESATH